MQHRQVRLPSLRDRLVVVVKENKILPTIDNDGWETVPDDIILLTADQKEDIIEFIKKSQLFINFYFERLFITIEETENKTNIRKLEKCLSRLQKDNNNFCCECILKTHEINQHWSIDDKGFINHSFETSDETSKCFKLLAASFLFCGNQMKSQWFSKNISCDGIYCFGNFISCNIKSQYSTLFSIEFDKINRYYLKDELLYVKKEWNKLN